jgi:hypothetical protein
LLLAAQEGTARRLYEETGLDFREQLNRLVPAKLRSEPTVDEHGQTIPTNEHNKQLYFAVTVSDEDFWSVDQVEDPKSKGFFKPMTTAGANLLVS